MRIKTRIAALLLTVLMLFTLAACTTDITYIVQKDDIKVYTGAYVCALIRGLNTAAEIAANSENPWNEEIDGMKLEDWIIADAHRTVEQYVAAQLKLQELGVSITEDEKQQAVQLAGLLKQYYGYYEANDVTDTELAQFCEMQIVMTRLFDTLYGKGGQREIPEADVLAEYDRNYQSFHILMFDRNDSEGKEFTGADLDAYNARVQEYLTVLREDPSRADEMICRYRDFRSSYIMGVQENTSNPLPTANDGEDKVEVTDQLQFINRLDQYTYPEEVLDAIRALPYDVPTLLEHDGIEYIAINHALPTDEESMAGLDLDLRMNLKQAEFYNELAEAGAALKLAYNGAAVRKYKPTTLNLAAVAG